MILGLYCIGRTYRQPIWGILWFYLSPCFTSPFVGNCLLHPSFMFRLQHMARHELAKFSHWRVSWPIITWSIFYYKCSTQNRLNEFHPAELLHGLKFPLELKASLHKYLRKFGTCYFSAQYYLCNELINKYPNLMDIIPTFIFPAGSPHRCPLSWRPRSRSSPNAAGGRWCCPRRSVQRGSFRCRKSWCPLCRTEWSSESELQN